MSAPARDGSQAAGGEVGHWLGFTPARWTDGWTDRWMDRQALPMLLSLGKECSDLS